MIYIILYFAALLALLSWTRKRPGPLPRDKITVNYTLYRTRKKPPEKRKTKNNITSRKAAKSDLLRAAFGVRCFRGPRAIATGTPGPDRFRTVKCGSDANRGQPGREEGKK